MYLNVILKLNIIFIILSSQCFTIHGYRRFPSKRYGFQYRFLGVPRTDHLDCRLPMELVDYKQPIPFTMNKTSAFPSVIHPNRDRSLYIKYRDYFNLACVGSRFITPVYVCQQNVSEITVRCLNTTFIGYEINGTLLSFEFDEFRCELVPKPTMKLTNERCQNMDHRVAEVGFQTKHFFLKSYSVCFGLEKKNALYSWYLVKCPMYEYRQASKTRTNFTNPILFDEINPQKEYEEQANLLGSLVNSTRLMKNPIYRVRGTRFFTPGRLTSTNAFIYAFEQQATFYYENTAPQWYIFQEYLWKNLERVIKIQLSQSRNKHVIVTGTYGTCTLQDESDIERPLYLAMNNRMTIPLYIWKLSYDLKLHNGIVYIGMNHPYKRVDRNNTICDVIVCPGGMLDRRAIDKQLLFCCTKDSFEITYGKIDHTVYREMEFIF